MGAINMILSSPLPTIVAVAIALLLAAGYWFFVLPLIEEAKELRRQNSELQQEVLDRIGVDTIINMGVCLDYVKDAVDRSGAEDRSGGGSALQAVLEEQRTSCRAIMDLVREVRTVPQTTTVNAQLDSIERNTERLLRNVSDINDKQSQVSGVILGLTMSRGNTPPRGP